MCASSCSVFALSVVLAVLCVAGCVVVYTGENRMLQPGCLVNCDATAARLEGSASGTIQQQDDKQGPGAPRIGGSR